MRYQKKENCVNIKFKFLVANSFGGCAFVLYCMPWNCKYTNSFAVTWVAKKHFCFFGFMLENSIIYLYAITSCNVIATDNL